MNKMVMAVIQRDLTEPILHSLLDAGFTATFNESRGGVLRQSQNSLFIAVAEKQLQDVLRIIKDTCRQHNEPIEIPDYEQHLKSPSDDVKTGDAVVFVWDINQMEKY